MILTAKPFDYAIYQYENNSLHPIIKLSFDTKYNLPKEKNIANAAEKTRAKNVVRYFDSFTKVGNRVFLIYSLMLPDLPFGFDFLSAVNMCDSSVNTICLGVQKNMDFPFGFDNPKLYDSTLFALISPLTYNRCIQDSTERVDEDSNLILLLYELKQQ